MRHFYFCLFLLCPVFCNAQDFKKISCRFLCLNRATPTPPLLNVAEKGVEVSCTITTESPSPPIVCYAKGTSLSFLSAADRKPAAIATIPANVNACILIFVDAAKAPNTLPWRVFVIEDSAKNFPDGGAFVANFHSQDIRFVIGENKIMLRPAGSHGFPRPEKRDNFNMAPVVFEFLQQDKWRTASESMLRFLPGMRYLIFAYVDPESGRPRISTIQDFRPVEKPPHPGAGGSAGISFRPSPHSVSAANYTRTPRDSSPDTAAGPTTPAPSKSRTGRPDPDAAPVPSTTRTFR
jgi:hypothetical protein